MKIEEQQYKYQALNRWFKTPQGVGVAKAFAYELHAVSDLLHGKQLLQLGQCGDNSWLSALNFNHQWVAVPDCDSLIPNTITTSLSALPLDRNSIDCVVAPLSFEAFGADKNPLDEIDRIVKPMGHIIFLGVNPWSFWGASLHFKRLSCFGGAPFFPMCSLKLKQIMLQRGYTQRLLRSFYYIPPVTHSRLIRTLSFLNEMGKMIWPFPAGFYCLIVQKYQPVTPNPLFFNTFDDELLYLARH